MKITHPHVASLLFNRPLLMHRSKLDVILAGIMPRIGMAPVIVQAPAGNAERPAMANEDGIAVIQVFGSMVKRSAGMDAMSGLTSYTELEEEILDAATDPKINAILLDGDSCGGEASGAFDLSDIIYRIRQVKPVYAIANDDALSAGYLLLSSAERLFITQTGLVGSIGVVAVHCDQSQYDEEEGFRYTIVTYGAHKADFSSHSPLSEDALSWLTADVNRLGEMFVGAVARNRGLDAEAVRATQAGLFAATKNGDTPSAIDLGLADEVGTRSDAIAALQDRIAGSRKLMNATRQRISAAALPAAQVKVSEVVPASVSAAEIKKEAPKMAEPNVADINKPNPPEVAAPPVVPAPAQAAAPALPATNMNAHEMQNLSDLCMIAGKPAALTGFLQRNLTFEAAKAELMKARVEAAGPEIQSQVLPDAGTKPVAGPNPLKAACGRLAGNKAVA